MPKNTGTKGVGPPPEHEVAKDYQGGTTRYKFRMDMILFLEGKTEADALACYLDDGRTQDAIELLHGVIDRLSDDSKHVDAAKKFIEVGIDPAGYDVKRRSDSA